MVLTGPSAAAVALSQLTHFRWALPVLAHVAHQGGCKRVTLARQLGITPHALTRALDRLSALDLVVRNPGYGHPMRPEYVLGALGEQTGALPAAVLRWADLQHQPSDMLKKWQLPVLVALGPEPTRFGDLRRRLPDATPRAVTMALKSHDALGLVARAVDRGYPPVARYSATRRALDGAVPARMLGECLATG